MKNVEALARLVAKLTGMAAQMGPPRYNVSPSQTNPIVRADEAGKPVATTMRWGLVPAWDKSEKPKFAPINARSEEVLGKPTFKQAVQKRRCLVPADGFFEWQRPDEKTKIPYRIFLEGEAPFFIAGIYEPEVPGRPETFALLTVGPNELMKPIHDRMPVIVDEAAAREWITPGELTPERAQAICVPYPADRMAAYQVSSIVNSARNEVPECVVPVIPSAPGPTELQGSLF